MAYSDYDNYNHRSRHDSYYSTSRDTDAYSRIAADKPPAMRYSQPASSYSSSYHHSYEPRYEHTLPSRPSARETYRPRAHDRWPPSPKVEDEAASLARETPSSAGSKVEEVGEAKSRGTVDQYPIIEELDRPPYITDNDERRYVLVSDPGADDDQHASGRRRKSFAERGNMPYLKTDVNDPPVFTERTSTPYAYTKPQKESLAPSPKEYYLSPESITPSTSSVPRSVPSRDARNARDQNARPERRPSPSARHDSYTKSPTTRAPRNNVSEDSDRDRDASYLRTEPRRSGQYSFVKSDLQKEDLRTNVVDNQAKPERRKHRDAAPSSSVNRESYSSGSNTSSASSKHPTPQTQSPRSSSSSLNGESRKQKPTPVETGYPKSSKYPDTYSSSPRPSSPSYRERSSPPRSPRLPPRPSSPATTARPLSRNGHRPVSPLSYPSTIPRSTPQATFTDSNWHGAYPPATERSRPISRHGRYESMPVPMPHINVKSPSPSRLPQPTSNPLPYPVDDRPTEAFMPPEENYQYDHSSTPTYSSPRVPYPETSIPGSPRLSAFRPPPLSRHNSNADEAPRSPRVRSNSMRSQSSQDGRRERRTAAPLSDVRPMPSCPRSEPSAKYNDWYNMDNCHNFDICPSCYDGVFADTPFAVYFSQSRRYERPKERFCDFSSPWIRLAWLLTMKQRRQTPDLLYALANVAETERPCPGDHELSSDHIHWYGIPDQRDGIHVANFAVCPYDLKMIEILFPSIRGYLTRLPPSSSYAPSISCTCSLRVNSRRFAKYLDLLVELDAEAELLGQRPNINRFVQLARENAFKNECQRDKALFGKPWHFIPQLPDFTVCQECFDEIIWPAISSSPTTTSLSSPYMTNNSLLPLPKLFNRTIQPVPTEDPEIGSSCCLYSARMRNVWERAVKDNDFTYLKRKVGERKVVEGKLARERRGLIAWMGGLERGSSQWERGKLELKGIEGEWREWE
ncbi:hypothetical protein CC80DRAFT_279029 [Byssothecium circinans]|uniref:Uncharacterized protein n=1 Tax=Byssothecium circinans TaxID=147558 RepID=A0A6A5TC32_9PLEO|nr:hypothetical protein CC80DRAFT_279029 [Byssothecium circinans]